MVIITGGAGFIGSAYLWHLNTQGRQDVLIVDNLEKSEKWRNLVGLKFQEYVHKDDFLLRLFEGEWENIEAIVHMGACSATTEKDMDYLMDNNVEYTKSLASWCLFNNARFVYASSAATYGNGAHGFIDNNEDIGILRPENRYGYSKQLFDLYALEDGMLDQIVGLKFFNVFGPNEYHKGEMKSVICKAHKQILDTGKIQLFKSYREDYPDGGQMRDFVYVKDCVAVIDYFVKNPDVNGLFNVGTGEARTWNDVANALFKSMDKEANIEYVEMPAHIRSHYQYYTQAAHEKLFKSGYSKSFTPLEAAVDDYVTQYLNDYVFLDAR